MQNAHHRIFLVYSLGGHSQDGASQVYGRVMVDLQNGKIWGFPTLTTAVYPVDISSTKPPVSHPFLLGTFALADTEK